MIERFFRLWNSVLVLAFTAACCCYPRHSSAEESSESLPCSIACCQKIAALFQRQSIVHALSETELVKGASLLRISQWLKEDGYGVFAFKGDAKSLNDPNAVYILHVNENHFLLVLHTDKGLVEIDPPLAPVFVDESVLKSIWDGIGLTVRVDQKKPLLSFVVDKTFISFGSLPTNEPGSADIQLFNVGSKDQKIKQIITSCSCLSPLFTSKAIKPGEFSKITLRFAGKAEATAVNQEVIIETDDPLQHYIRIQTHADIVSSGAIWPPLINLGGPSKGSIVSRTVKLTNPGAKIDENVIGKLDWISGTTDVRISLSGYGNVITINFEMMEDVSSLCAGVLTFMDKSNGKTLGNVGVQANAK